MVDSSAGMIAGFARNRKKDGGDAVSSYFAVIRKCPRRLRAQHSSF